MGYMVFRMCRVLEEHVHELATHAAVEHRSRDRARPVAAARWLDRALPNITIEAPPNSSTAQMLDGEQPAVAGRP